MHRISPPSLRFWIPVLVLSACGASPAQAEVPGTTACLECHAVEGERPAGQAADGMSLFRGDWDHSVHAGLECTDCHTGIQSLPHDTPLPRAQCTTCHEDVVARYSTSAHGVLAAAGDTQAPNCASCHDPHRVRAAADSTSELHRSRVAMVCTQCHVDRDSLATRQFAVPHPAQSYLGGAHALAIASGNLKAATCDDCHDSHDVRRAQDPLSSVFRRAVPATCGRCHTEEFDAYRVGVHGRAVERGSTDSPVCNTCHGEHTVVRLGEPGISTVVASETCESCHESPALTRRYDLPRGAVASYEDSYHGRAARGGLAQAAGCTSCHGVHRILPKADPESSIHPARLQATCSTCHTGATQSFATSYAHGPRQATAGDGAAARVRQVYVLIIGLVIGGMLVHNAILYRHDLAIRFARHRERATHERLNRNEVVQHTVLTVSFTLLALSGFALRYPETASALSAIGFDESARRIVHRGAAIVFIGVSVAHGIYLCTRRGRDQLREMLPRKLDLGHAIANVRYHLGRASKPPAFTRFRYIEKAEYWALVWGTGIMIVTGLILWFPVRLDGPSWLVKVSEAIHLYEAWLAVLAILVWHLFFVLVRPGIDGSFTAITGKMSVEDLAHEHPAEYAKVYTHLPEEQVLPGPGAHSTAPAPPIPTPPQSDRAADISDGADKKGEFPDP